MRKRFFREALLQITIPFLLKKLAPTCKSVSSPGPPLSPSPQPRPGPGSRSQPDPRPGRVRSADPLPPGPDCPPRPLQELPRFQELIFEDFARFILVENTYEEVVLQTVMKDILQGACQPPGGGR